MKNYSESLTIFFPFFNDAGTVEKMISDAYKYGLELTDDLEVIAVNDGSSDNTLNELNRLKSIYPDLKVINHELNKGYGGALISGIKNSTKEWVFYTDGDAQYHVDELKKVWDIKSGFDAVNGYKKHRSDNIIRLWVGHSYRLATKALFKTPIIDIDCDFRLIKGDIIRSLDLHCTSGAITVEMIKKLSLAGAKFKQIGVNHYERVYGNSTFFTPKRILNTIIDEYKLIREFKKFK
ncbi:MAG: glycosyltransferase family 2 protein [bacterium]